MVYTLTELQQGRARRMRDSNPRGLFRPHFVSNEAHLATMRILRVDFPKSVTTAGSPCFEGARSTILTSSGER